MSRHIVLRLTLLAAGTLLIGACASSPSLLDKKFEREAQTFQKVEHQGKTLYCKHDDPTGPRGWRCLTEAQLRAQVDNYQRTRNTSIGTPIPAGAGQGSVGR